MVAALIFLERMVLVGIGIFALYQCFQIADRDSLRRPALAWTACVCLIAVAGICFFTVARLIATH